VGEPVRLRFFGSSVRRRTRSAPCWTSGRPKSWWSAREIELNLPAAGRAAGEVVPVTLARVTDIGTLGSMPCPWAEAKRWKVEFDVRAETSAEAAE
jgi:hypothetical protein